MNNSDSAETVASNQALLNQILFRLPEKSLSRFKSVSKPWLDQISSPKFSQDLARAKNPESPIVSGLLLYTTRDPKAHIHSYFPEPALFLHSFNPSVRPSGPSTVVDFLGTARGASGLKILGSCNGLILCSCFLNSGIEYADNFYLVCNPTTKDFDVVAEPELSAWGERVADVVLVYDPWKLSPYFRLVLVWKGRAPGGSDNMVGVGYKIYYSETREWSSCRYSNEIPRSVLLKKGVYWNRNIHFINEDFGKKSYYFSMVEEEMKIFPVLLPSLSDGSDQDVNKPQRLFAQSGTHLYMLEWRRNMSPSFNVYDVTEDYSRWNLVYHIPTEEIRSALNEAGHDYVTLAALSAVPLGVVCDNNNGAFEVVCGVSNGVICYDPRNRAAKLLMRLEESGRSSLVSWHNFAQFSETLAPVYFGQKYKAQGKRFYLVNIISSTGDGNLAVWHR